MQHVLVIKMNYGQFHPTSSRPATLTEHLESISSHKKNFHGAFIFIAGIYSEPSINLVRTTQLQGYVPLSRPRTPLL